uniref:Uncharacterized protein n=1 Tax=Oncorhynchus tshawytscha TaxID=74940 RepID=A0AAZ3QAY0_ONCTS
MRRRPSETASTSGTLAVRDCIKCLFSRNQYSIQSPSSNVCIGVSAGSGSLASESDRGSCGGRLKVGADRHRVWLLTQNLPLRLPCRKLGPRFVGTFKVLRRVNEMHTPANTPATPPNFPDALTMFSRLKASESFNASSPIASMATSPPQVNWAMGPSAPGQTQQGLWTSGQMPSQVPPPGWPQAVTQQASSEQASVTMEAER